MARGGKGGGGQGGARLIVFPGVSVVHVHTYIKKKKGRKYI